MSGLVEKQKTGLAEYACANRIQVSLLRIGHERQPLVVVDDFVRAPTALGEAATQGAAFKVDQSDYYPGERKPIEAGYADFVCRFFLDTLCPMLGYTQTRRVTTLLSAFSRATQSPGSLLPIQRIPHFDACDAQQWAMVHYLCGPEYGGTGFFRHNGTGFESIDQTRVKKYQRVLEDEAATKGLPAQAYLQGSTELFTLMHSCEAKFNRALFYPGKLLHSGLIKKWQSHQHQAGRLTANVFLAISEG